MKRVIEESVYDDNGQLASRSQIFYEDTDCCNCEEDPLWMSNAIAEIYRDGEEMQQKLRKLYNSVCDEEASDEA